MDPSTVKVFQVGNATPLIASVSGQAISVSGIPKPGTIDLIVTAASTGAGLLDSAADRGVRINNVEIADGKTKDLASLDVPKNGGAKGQVTLSTGASLALADFGLVDSAGIDIFVPGTSYIAKSAADGTFAMDGLPVGDSPLYFEHQGFRRGIAQVTVKSADTVSVSAVILVPDTGADGFIQIPATADSETVNVVIGATDDAVLMKVSADSELKDAKWQPVQSNIPWTFSADGEQTLYVKFSNANALESATYSATVKIALPVNASAWVEQPSAASLSADVLSACSNSTATVNVRKLYGLLGLPVALRGSKIIRSCSNSDGSNLGNLLTFDYGSMKWTSQATTGIFTPPAFVSNGDSQFSRKSLLVGDRLVLYHSSDLSASPPTRTLYVYNTTTNTSATVDLSAQLASFGVRLTGASVQQTNSCDTMRVYGTATKLLFWGMDTSSPAVKVAKSYDVVTQQWSMLSVSDKAFSQSEFISTLSDTCSESGAPTVDMDGILLHAYTGFSSDSQTGVGFVFDGSSLVALSSSGWTSPAYSSDKYNSALITKQFSLRACTRVDTHVGCLVDGNGNNNAPVTTLMVYDTGALKWTALATVPISSTKFTFNRIGNDFFLGDFSSTTSKPSFKRIDPATGASKAVSVDGFDPYIGGSFTAASGTASGMLLTAATADNSTIKTFVLKP